MIDISLDVSEVVEGLKRAGKLVSRNVKQALEISADLVANEAKRNHDYNDQTGVLTNSIASDGVTGQLGSGMEAIVAAGAEHGIYVEKGTKAHVIKPKHRKALRFPAAGGGFAFAKEVNHPGTTGTYFLENALDRKLPEVTDLLESATAAAFAEAGFED